MPTSITYKKIWQVSLPIIISGIAQNIVNVTDTAFLGQVSKVALGAAGNAGIFYFLIVITGMGFTTGSQILIARRNGEKNYGTIGKILDHTFYFVIPLGIIIFGLVYFFGEAFLQKITTSNDIFEASKNFINYRIWGIVLAFLNFSFIAFFVGITNTKVLSWATSLMMLVNVFLDYALIFGNFGFPEMGIEGAALASVISELAALVLLVIYTLKVVDVQQFQLFKFHKLDLTLLKKMFGISSPIMLQNFLSLSSWFIFFIIIEKMGENELAVSHIIRSIYMVLMIPLFGFSNATNTLVSNLIGEGKTDMVLSLIKKIIWMSLACTFVLSIVSYCFPEPLLAIYTNDPTLLSYGIDTLEVINFTMFFFSIAFILFNGVTGTGNTRTSLLIEFINICIYLSCAYYIAVSLKASLPMVWCSEFIYFGLLGGLSYLYLRFGNWQKKEI